MLKSMIHFNSMVRGQESGSLRQWMHWRKDSSINLLQIGPGRTDETQGRHAESPWSWSAYTGLNRDNRAVMEKEMEKDTVKKPQSVVI